MRVAVFSPAWFAVPPERYGGIEMIVHSLVEGLVDNGLEVTLFASGDSTTRAELVSVFQKAPSERIGQTFWELQHALSFLERVDDFDLVHDHSGLLGLTLFGLTRCPLIHTVHGPLTGNVGAIYERACAIAHDVSLVSLTNNQKRPRPSLPWIATIPNAIDPASYTFEPRPGESLLFLGRMSPDKGAHRAIEVARRAGRPLTIAAKCHEPAEMEYFERYVEPHLGTEVEYVGEVGHAEKCRLLQQARALLVPIDWEEPFGLVMIEALACGTPVIALGRGSVPELVKHGETGFIADDLEGMTAAVEHVCRLDPSRMRADVERRFSVERMTAEYIEAYEMVAAMHGVASTRSAA